MDRVLPIVKDEVGLGLQGRGDRPINTPRTLGSDPIYLITAGGQRHAGSCDPGSVWQNGHMAARHSLQTIFGFTMHTLAVRKPLTRQTRVGQ